MGNEHASTIDGISSIICNAITVLWDAGEHDAARKKILMVEDQSPVSAIAAKHGASIYTLTSPEPLLAVQFPSCMFLVLPLGVAETIISEIFANRRDLLLSLMEEEKDDEDNPGNPREALEPEVLKPTFIPTAGLPDELLNAHSLYAHQLEPGDA